MVNAKSLAWRGVGGQVDWNLVTQHGSEQNPLRVGDVPTWVTLLSLFSWHKLSLAEGIARQKNLFPLLHSLRANMQVFARVSATPCFARVCL